MSDDRILIANRDSMPVHLHLNGRMISIDKSKIYYLTPASDDRCILVLTGGEEIEVSLSLPKLEHMLQWPDLRCDKIDLLPYTKTNGAWSFVDAAVKGKTTGPFEVEGYFHNNCSDSKNLYERRRVSSQDISYLQEGCDDKVNKTFLGPNGPYIDLPVSMMQQFMTHAVKSCAAVLDLSSLSYPSEAADAQKKNLKASQPLYKSDLFPYKPY